MSYIETIKQGNKEYYYLTKNIRLSSNKWKKVRVFIGDEKPSKEELRRLARAIEEKAGPFIKKSTHLYLSDLDAETLQDLKEGYSAWKKQASKDAKEKTNEDFMIRFTYNSNAIEGNRLTLRQTALILKDKVIPSGVQAYDYNEAINGKECLEYITSYNGELNLNFLESINGILIKNTEAVNAGKIRYSDVQISGSNHVPPHHAELKKHLLNLFKWYSANKNKLHPFELAVLLHAKIAWIHPFEDGNGRTARAIMNFVLMKKGFPMFFIPFEKREDYYNALEIADKGDYKEYTARMLQLIIDQVRSYGHKNR